MDLFKMSELWSIISANLPTLATSKGASVPGIILANGLLNIPITLYVSYVVISTACARVAKKLKAMS